MARAAVLGAKEVITARCGRLEPEARVAAGQHVRLDAKRRHEKIMDDVLGRHDQFHGSAHGYVQFVDFPLAVEVLKLPHPLLRHDVHVQRLIGRSRHGEEHAGAPHEDHHRDQKRDDGPGQLEDQAAMDVCADGIRRTAAVLDGVVNDQDSDQQREESRQGDQEKIQRIHTARHRGSLLRKKRSSRPHNRITARFLVRRAWCREGAGSGPAGA